MLFLIFLVLISILHIQVVIGNLLQSRKHRVVLVEPHDETEIILSQDQENQGLEIEELIIGHLTVQHAEFIVHHP